MDKQYTVNDFFCGCGGMGLGFKQAGYITAGAWDFDKFAVESYRHNVDPVVAQADIQQMHYADIPAADVWTFGFPCQDLSIAGKQAGLYEGTRSRLFFEIMRLIDELDMMGEERPKVIMAENVKALKPYLPVLEEEYSKRGYKTYYILYNSQYWGAPQRRERYFVLGVREDLEKNFVFPKQGKVITKQLIDVLDKGVEEKYYSFKIPDTVEFDEENLTVKIKEATKKGYAIGGLGDSINMIHPNSSTRRGRVGKGVFQTIMTGTEQFIIDPETKRLRKITPGECGKAQGFPMDTSWEQVVSDTQAYKQFGNAVTVNVAEAIAKAIMEQILI